MLTTAPLERTWLAWWLPKGIPRGNSICAALPSPAQEAPTKPLAAQSCIDHQPPTRTQSHMAEIKCCYLGSMLFSVKSATSTLLEFRIHPRLARHSAPAAANQTNLSSIHRGRRFRQQEREGIEQALTCPWLPPCCSTEVQALCALMRVCCAC